MSFSTEELDQADREIRLAKTRARTASDNSMIAECEIAVARERIRNAAARLNALRRP